MLMLISVYIHVKPCFTKVTFVYRDVTWGFLVSESLCVYKEKCDWALYLLHPLLFVSINALHANECLWLCEWVEKSRPAAADWSALVLFFLELHFLGASNHTRGPSLLFQLWAPPVSSSPQFCLFSVSAHMTSQFPLLWFKDLMALFFSFIIFLLLYL